jgi:hypothetical protein
MFNKIFGEAVYLRATPIGERAARLSRSGNSGPGV